MSFISFICKQLHGFEYCYLILQLFTDINNLFANCLIVLRIVILAKLTFRHYLLTILRLKKKRLSIFKAHLTKAGGTIASVPVLEMNSKLIRSCQSNPQFCSLRSKSFEHFGCRVPEGSATRIVFSSITRWHPRSHVGRGLPICLGTVCIITNPSRQTGLT